MARSPTCTGFPWPNSFLHRRIFLKMEIGRTLVFMVVLQALLFLSLSKHSYSHSYPEFDQLAHKIETNPNLKPNPNLEHLWQHVAATTTLNRLNLRETWLCSCVRGTTFALLYFEMFSFDKIVPSLEKDVLIWQCSISSRRPAYGDASVNEISLCVKWGSG